MKFIIEFILDALLHFAFIFGVIWTVFYFFVLDDLRSGIKNELVSICKLSINPYKSQINSYFTRNYNELTFGSYVKNVIQHKHYSVNNLITKMNNWIFYIVICVVIFVLLAHLLVYYVYNVSTVAEHSIIHFMGKYFNETILENVVVCVLIGVCEAYFIFTYAIKYIPLTTSDFITNLKSSLNNLIG